MTINLYLPFDLSDQELIDYCDFTEDDFTIANQTQIDFILVCDYYTTNLPYLLSRHFHLNSNTTTLTNKTINGIEMTIIIFWH